VISKIARKIRECKSFMISAHVNLEGDALGSCLAMCAALKKMRKKAVVFNHDVTPDIYSFLPNASDIRNELAGENFDAAIVLDCSDAARAGKVKDYLSKVGCIINIDHHISNTYFGDINWVDSNASSACEMLYFLCRELKVMDKNIAECLYTGISTDTGNFTYANATAQTHRVVAQLMQHKINPHKIYENLHSLCVPDDMTMMGHIFSSLRFDARRKICWCLIPHWEDKTYDLTEIIFTTMRLLKGVEVFILFKRVEKNKVRVNFRSRAGVDVNRIAQFFGGGGHKKASGTTMEDTLESAERKVLSFVKRYTNGSKKNRNPLRNQV